MFARPNRHGSFKISATISLLQVGLASLCVVNTQAGAAPPVNPCIYVNCDTTTPPIAPQSACSASSNLEDYPRYVYKFNDRRAGTVPAAIDNLAGSSGTGTTAAGTSGSCVP
jgi:hypothetical protein